MKGEMAILRSEDGRELELPREAFDALWDFTHGHRKSGVVSIEFKTGGTVGVNGRHVVVTSEIRYK